MLGPIAGLSSPSPTARREPFTLALTTEPWSIQTSGSPAATFTEDEGPPPAPPQACRKKTVAGLRVDTRRPPGRGRRLLAHQGLAAIHTAMKTILLAARSEEHTSELQSRGLISYAVFCLK